MQDSFGASGKETIIFTSETGEFACDYGNYQSFRETLSSHPSLPHCVLLSAHAQVSSSKSSPIFLTDVPSPSPSSCCRELNERTLPLLYLWFNGCATGHGITNRLFHIPWN